MKGSLHALSAIAIKAALYTVWDIKKGYAENSKKQLRKFSRDCIVQS